MAYQLLQNGQPILTGDEFIVREKIEELLEERIGFFVSLQENTDDDEYHFYLHTDNEQDVSDEDWPVLTEQYGLNCWDDENSEFLIKQLLNIEVRILEA